MQFDIVIPFHKKDIEILQLCVESCKYILDKKNIFIVSKEKTNIENTIWISEEIFPFTAKELLTYNTLIPEKRINWYLQQFIKLHSFLIPNITETFLVLDADVIFLQPLQLLTNNVPVYNYSNEHTHEYFECMKRLHTYFERSVNKSGICHFMMFEKKVIFEIFELIKKENEEIWETIIKNVTNWHHGFSEYELYFHYIFKKYVNAYSLKQYKYQEIDNFQELAPFIQDKNLSYIACHSWNRK